MGIEIIGKITRPQTIAVGRRIREIERLQKALRSRQMAKAEGHSDSSASRWYDLRGRGPLVRSTRRRPEGIQDKAHPWGRIMKRARPESEYVVCVSNGGYRASLIVRRIYRTIPDQDASRRGLLRVIDESGEDYLFPEKLFAVIELPKSVGRKLALAI